jgi:hypothetical protein
MFLIFDRLMSAMRSSFGVVFSILKMVFFIFFAVFIYAPPRILLSAEFRDRFYRLLIEPVVVFYLNLIEQIVNGFPFVYNFEFFYEDWFPQIVFVILFTILHYVLYVYEFWLMPFMPFITFVLFQFLLRDFPLYDVTAFR